MHIGPMPKGVTVEQLSLLVDHNLPFVVGSNHRENDRPIFVFGRTRGFSAMLHDRGVGDADDYKEAIWQYVQEQANLRVYAMTYSELSPTGRDMFISVGACWPCGEGLFRKAQAVGFDFTRDEAPLEELHELIVAINASNGGRD